MFGSAEQRNRCSQLTMPQNGRFRSTDPYSGVLAFGRLKNAAIFAWSSHVFGTVSGCPYLSSNAVFSLGLLKRSERYTYGCVSLSNATQNVRPLYCVNSWTVGRPPA